jgi:hypothetical protein
MMANTPFPRLADDFPEEFERLRKAAILAAWTLAEAVSTRRSLNMLAEKVVHLKQGGADCTDLEFACDNFGDALRKIEADAQKAINQYEDAK